MREVHEKLNVGLNWQSLRSIIVHACANGHHAYTGPWYTEDVIGSYDPTTSYTGYGFFGSVISVASFTRFNRGGYGLFFGSVVSVAVTYDSRTRGVECV